MVRTDDTGGVSILRPESGALEKRDMDQNHPQHSKERVGGVSNGSVTADWVKQMTERTRRGTQDGR